MHREKGQKHDDRCMKKPPETWADVVFHSCFRLLLVSACTGKAAIEAYCDLHVEAMDMYAAKHKLDFIQVSVTREARKRSGGKQQRKPKN